MHQQSKSISVEKRKALRNVLSWIAILVGTFYLVVDELNSISGGLYLYLSVLTGGILSKYLNRKGQHYLSSIVLLLTINLVVFLNVESDRQFNSGTHVYFICTTITAFGLLGLEHIKTAIAFAVFSLLLYVISFSLEVPWVDERVIPENLVNFFYSFNLIIALVTSTFIVFYLLVINRYIETNLNNHAQSLEVVQTEIIDKNKELVQINKELDHFVYSVSHDLRSPLSSILGLINVYFLTKDSVERDAIVNRMQGRVDKLDAFIREILDYSRNSRIPVKKQRVILHDLIKETWDALSYMYGFDLIRLQCEIDMRSVEIDQERLKVVLNNIFSNAIKYSDIQKPEKWVDVNIQFEADRTIINIEDNGIGVEAVHLTKIFDMFYRGTEASDGSGLGLYIVKEVLDKMNGGIVVHSTYTQGSRFTITLKENSSV